MRKRVCTAQWLLHHSICCLNRLESPVQLQTNCLGKKNKEKTLTRSRFARNTRVLSWFITRIFMVFWFTQKHENTTFFCVFWANLVEQAPHKHLGHTRARTHAHTHAPISSQVSITQRPTSDRITDAGTADRTHEPPLHFEFIDFLWRLQHANTRSRKQTNAFGH